mgnify:FL=1
MAEERTPRESETRENDSYHPSDDWVPASILPSPNPQPGWTFRWIRTDILGQSDNTNVSRSFREGWQPCKVDDHPELQIMSDIGSRFEGNVHFGGLLLCKAPEEKMQSRTRHYQEVANTQMESVDNNYLRENDPRMPMMKPERNTRTTFGRS